MPTTENSTPQVGVIMGSDSDWKTMRAAAEVLEQSGIPHEKRVVSAHRTPDDLFEYAGSAESRGLSVIIAGAGGAAHLPGMTAAKTIVPVIGVPVAATPLKGIDALLSIMQMPAEIGVATVCVGNEGAAAAGVLATRIMAIPRGHSGVGIVYASEHLEILLPVFERLKALKIPTVVGSFPPGIPDTVFRAWMQEQERGGVAVWITAYEPGIQMATRLAAHTTRPVLNVPLIAGPIESVEEFVQPFLNLPTGIATFAIGKAGAINAALFAATIVSERGSPTWELLRRNRALQVERVHAMKLE